MIVDFIILGLGNILGFELVIATLLFFTILLTGMSRGIGLVSLMVVFMMSVYLFVTYPIDQIFLLDTTFGVVTYLIFAFLMGIMFFTLVIRE